MVSQKMHHGFESWFCTRKDSVTLVLMDCPLAFSGWILGTLGDSSDFVAKRNDRLLKVRFICKESYRLLHKRASITCSIIVDVQEVPW